MKKTIFLITLITVIFSINLNTKALTYGGCEYSEISNLKLYISNINLSYDYYIKDNSAYFDITLSNLVPGLYFEDSITGNIYHYEDTIDGEITLFDYRNTAGNFKFYSALKECYGVKLSNKYYQLPEYNYYYLDPICEQNRNFSLCQKWVKVNYSYSDFIKLIEDFKNKEQIEEENNENLVEYEKNFLDKFVNFYTRNYYILLLGIIIICTIVMLINKRKNKFDL